MSEGSIKSPSRTGNSFDLEVIYNCGQRRVKFKESV